MRVVFCAGLGLPASVWAPVVDRLSVPGEVVLLDRPGLGRLAHGQSRPLVLRAEVERIVEAVVSTGDAPVVLVGHSMAGFLVEATARLHPELTAGLVLVDGSVEKGFRPSGSIRTTAHAVAASAARRLHLGAATEALIAENCSFPDLAHDLEHLRHTHLLPEIPVEVLAAVRREWWPPNRAWLRRQRRLCTTLGANSVRPEDARIELEIVWGSGHLVMRDAPDVVAAAITRLHAGS